MSVDCLREIVIGDLENADLTQAEKGRLVELLIKHRENFPTNGSNPICMSILSDSRTYCKSQSGNGHIIRRLIGEKFMSFAGPKKKC